MKQLKTLSALIAMLLCSTCLFAHDFEVNGIYYNILSSTDRTVEVTYKGNSGSSYSDEYSGNISIFENVTYNGFTYSVTSIGSSAFSRCSGLTSVTIPNSVTSIGDDAFYYCSGLTSVTIPNSVTSIGGAAFMGCSGLTSVTIPNSVTSIGNYAFCYCSGLTSVTIPNSVTSIGGEAFCYCSGLTSVTIGNSVTSIGDCAFRGCSGLTSVTIPNSVTSIGNYAFEDCSGLTSVTIPNSVTSIGGYAFQLCSGLTSVTIGNSVTSIENGAFAGCSGLTSVTIGNSVTSIENGAFSGCSGLTSVTIPNSVTRIGQYAFYGCSGLTSVTIPNSVTSIGDVAFGYCSGLTSIVVDKDNTVYDSRNNCNAIIESSSNTLVLGCNITKIPNIVTSIGDCAFRGCSGLTSVTIPNSVTSIGSSAFEGCMGLTSVTIGNSVESIGDEAFYDCSGLKLVINLSDLNIISGSSGYGYVAYYADRVATGDFIDGDYVWAETDGEYTLVSYLGNETNLVLPDGYNGKNYAIGSSAFSGCSGLTSVTIPNSVTSIGNYAFEDCSGLTSVTIPNSVTSIGDWAFSYCSGLTSVTIPNSVTSIGDRTFYYCSGLTSVTIPNSVTSIGNSAFYYCSDLTSVTIPNSVTSIGNTAFSGCSSLTSVTIGNSVESIGFLAFYYCSGLKLVINLSDLNIISGSSDNGYVAHYADRVATGDFIDGDYVWAETDGEYTLVSYLGNETNLVLPDGYNGENYAIGSSAFAYCSGLTSVTIPNSVTSISNSAFANCKSLKEVFVGCKWIETPLYNFNDEIFVNIDSHNYENGVCAVCGKSEFDYYNMTFVIDGKEYVTIKQKFGETPILPETPTKEGYTFSGWSEVPSTMPSEDVTVTGTFTINKYAVKYIVDGEVVATDSVEYNSAITLREGYDKTGYTFLQWNGAPETMPANDINITAEYKVNTYTISYVADGEVIVSYPVEYGTTLTVLPLSPEKEGHTFSGWSEVPGTMPAEDVTVTGTFTVNKYLVTFVVDGEVYATDSVEYGAEIVLPEVPEKENSTFAWEGEIPTTMPANEVTIYGNYATGIFGVEAAEQVDVYTISGMLYRKAMNFNELNKELPRGLYIVNGKKYLVK